MAMLHFWVTGAYLCGVSLSRGRGKELDDSYHKGGLSEVSRFVIVLELVTVVGYSFYLEFGSFCELF